MRLRKRGVPERAPASLDGLSDAQLSAAIRTRTEYVQRARDTRAKAIPAGERETVLQGLRETVNDLRRLEQERERRPEPVPAGSSALHKSVPVFRSREERDAHRAAERARQEAAWEKREREKREQAERRRQANEARQEERRRREADEGIGPPSPEAWSSFHADGTDLLAAVMSDQSLWFHWLGRDPDRLDRNPPLHAADLLVLYSVLATLAARGTPEVVLPQTASSKWVPVGFGAAQSSAINAATSLRQLAANGFLALRQDGGRFYVSAGPVAVAARDAYLERNRLPQGRPS